MKLKMNKYSYDRNKNILMKIGIVVWFILYIR